jgi:hypothetical protein
MMAVGRGSVHDVIHPEDKRKATLDGIFSGASEIVTRQRCWSRYEFWGDFEIGTPTGHIRPADERSKAGK